MCMLFFFFFSSRRRHTRYWRDWSSDVCSSDLGSAQISNGQLNQYNGQATLYLSGTMYFNGKLCGGVSGTSCDFTNWNPNTELLTFVAEESSPGGIANKPNAGYSIQMFNNSEFQGGLFATHAINLLQNTKTDGPMVASY